MGKLVVLGEPGTIFWVMAGDGSDLDADEIAEGKIMAGGRGEVDLTETGQVTVLIKGYAATQANMTADGTVEVTPVREA